MRSSTVVALLLFLAPNVTGALPGPVPARDTLSVFESATRLHFTDYGVEVALAVENRTHRSIDSKILVELIDPTGDRRAIATRNQLISPGKSTIICPLEVLYTVLDKRTAVWWRLRYLIEPIGATTAALSARGVLSVSEITPDLFEISVVAPGVIGGRSYRAGVRATHPVTSRPLAGVKFEARILYQHDKKGGAVSRSSGVSDESGYSTLEFAVPAELKGSFMWLEVSGSRAGVSRQADGQVYTDRATRVTIATDKPLYQPGQTIHVRILAQKPDGRAAPQTRFELRVHDPEGTTVFRAELVTSRFGVAAIDWPIPANARLGDYRVGGDLDEAEHDGFSWRWQKVRISRYELPNFSVRAKSDRSHYLPGQNAEIEIGADYLFGQPVTKGRVKLVQESSREWNYREQKWDVEEGQKFEGELDRRGRFVASVNLDRYHAELAERDYRRFDDLTWAASVTDATTGRTEQRRFDLRVTREPIHVYLLSNYGLNQQGRYPDFYITSFYADGEPARCDVDVLEEAPASAADNRFRERLVARVSTNQYGVGKATRVPLSPGQETVKLKLIARDGKGNTGQESDSYSRNSDSMIRIETARTIHAPGDPIEVTIESDPPATWAVVDLARGWKLLRSERVELRGGRARLVLPYSSDFIDELSVAAYTQDGPDRWDSAQRVVLYPNDRELRFSVKTHREQYRPGEDATAEFVVRTSAGQPVKSVLGVSVTDRAVDERIRTDTEFGSGAGLYFYDQFSDPAETLAGVDRAVLNKLETSRPIPPDLDLVAEVVLRHGGYCHYLWKSERASEPAQVFRLAFEKQLSPILATLRARYLWTGEYPADSASFLREMHDSGIAFEQMVDPWGQPYIPTFKVEEDKDVLEINTAGPDKQRGTADDFTAVRDGWPYFKPTGGAIDRAVASYHQRTGGFIRDRATLERELLREGIRLDSLRDRWGEPYRLDFQIRQTRFVVEIGSGGANRRFERTPAHVSDDFTAWTSPIDYSLELRKKVDSALAGNFDSTARLPENEQEFDRALSGNRPEELLDPWGHRYYPVFRTTESYGSRVTIYSYGKYQEARQRKTEITPVTRRTAFVTMRSAGPDSKEGTPDDFDVLTFSRVLAETTPEGVAKEPLPAIPPLSDGQGAITGIVVDSEGAVVANARVTAKGPGGAVMAEGRSGADGRYLLQNLPAGTYEVRFDSTGFKTSVFTDVPVTSSNITEVNVNLEPGVVSESVTVTADAALLQTQSRASSATVSRISSDNARRPARSGGQQISTPRLREYFPETLVWSPEIETDEAGRAQLKFKLADSITTWKLSAIASTIDGEVGIIEKDILAFQPFFVEHAPPPVLTEGDQIALPVVVRNYLERPQSVQLEVAPAPWFKLTSAATQRIEVLAGESANKIFDFQAIASIDGGTQRITALASEASDAIEKRVSVHPDGQEIFETASQIVGALGLLETAVPQNSIAGSWRSELKIYPNLMAHLLESVQAVMERPYGCAEQTISAAYPSLLLLQQKKGVLVPDELRQRALGYVRTACDELLNYRSEDGGFTYWGRGDSDRALTAYALRFLTAAREFVTIDQKVIEEARAWLVKRQQPDGRWIVLDAKGKEIHGASALLTAYIARALTGSGLSQTGEPHAEDQRTELNMSVRKTLGYLSKRADEIDEPYLIASYALVALGAGDNAAAGSAVARLRTLARNESTSSYWALETNTPFHGWGIAGRLETTALAVQAMAANAAAHSASNLPVRPAADPRDEQMISRGLDFLLRYKDRYGVWYSTQTTMNVLDTLVTLIGRNESNASAGGPAQILVNGVAAASVEMPPPGQIANPISVNLSPFIRMGPNRVEIRRGHGAAQASAQLVISHWEPWNKAEGAKEDGRSSAGGAARRTSDPASRALRLRVRYDKTEAAVGEEIKVNVEAERVGFSGYGMMLAEIGLPPGADVDRASLETAMVKSGWEFEQYDVLPDRLIVYLWPRGGGTRFEFKFRLRFGLNAQTSPSVLYDYYNPEARVVVAPARFKVK